MNQRIKLTKRLLHESLLELLESKPVDEVSVKELCEKAEINRSTFYAHYGCVRDIVREIEDEVIDDICRLSASEKLSMRERMVKICKYLYDNRNVELLLFRNYTDTDLEKVFETVNADLKQLRLSANPHTDITPENTELTLAFVNHGIFNLIKTWLVNDVNMSPEDVASLIFDRILKIP